MRYLIAIFCPPLAILAGRHSSSRAVRREGSQEAIGGAEAETNQEQLKEHGHEAERIYSR